MTYPASLYAATLREPPSAVQTLQNEIDCDVCIVGGGYTGLSAALHLAERGFEVVLLEAERVGWGASGRNGGQLGSAHTVLQPKLAKRYGPDKAEALWRVAEEAKRLVKDLIATHGIDCAYQDGNMGCAVSEGDLSVFAAHADFVARHYDYPHYQLFDRERTAAIAGNRLYAGALYDPTAGHLNPLRLALGLARAAKATGARLYEESQVEEVIPGAKVTVKTAKGAVRADTVLLGCNGYLGRLAPALLGRIVTAENYQLATEPLADGLRSEILTNRACLWDTHHQVYYYRMTPEGRLVFGGGIGFPGQDPEDMATIVRRHLLRVYPQLEDVRIDYAWGGTFANTFNKLPDFGRLAPNILYAQGYSGHGLALAVFGGRALADLLTESPGVFDLLASIRHFGIPGRGLLHGPLLAAGIAHVWLLDRLRRF